MYARWLRGMGVYLHTPRLRALLALNLVAAAGGAMVFVNTIVIVRSAMGGSDQDVAWALAAFGGGSMLAALLLPGLLDRQHDRRIRSEEHTSELQSLMRISYAVFCLKKKKK